MNREAGTIRKYMTLAAESTCHSAANSREYMPEKDIRIIGANGVLGVSP